MEYNERWLKGFSEATPSVARRQTKGIFQGLGLIGLLIISSPFLAAGFYTSRLFLPADAEKMARLLVTVVLAIFYAAAVKTLFRSRKKKATR